MSVPDHEFLDTARKIYRRILDSLGTGGVDPYIFVDTMLVALKAQAKEDGVSYEDMVGNLHKFGDWSRAYAEDIWDQPITLMMEEERDAYGKSCENPDVGLPPILGLGDEVNA